MGAWATGSRVSPRDTARHDDLIARGFVASERPVRVDPGFVEGVLLDEPADERRQAHEVLRRPAHHCDVAAEADVKGILGWRGLPVA